jgi:hypothetical protein
MFHSGRLFNHFLEPKRCRQPPRKENFGVSANWSPKANPTYLEPAWKTSEGRKHDEPKTAVPCFEGGMFFILSSTLWSGSGI